MEQSFSKSTILKSSIYGIILLSLLIARTIPATGHSLAQTISAAVARNPSYSTHPSMSEAWTIPVNISQSGAASQPFIAAGKGATLQVFWLDRIDGLVSSKFDGEKWSTPQKNHIPRGPTQMPYLVADRSGKVHAFWQVARHPIGNKQADVMSLFHSQINVGGSVWSNPVMLAEDALVYSVYAPVGGGLSMAYIRQLNTQTEPTGVYVTRQSPFADLWEPAQTIYSSIYYRLLSQTNSSIVIADDSAGHRFVIWNDPYQNQTLISQSPSDNPTLISSPGKSWSEPTSFGASQLYSAEQIQPGAIRLAAMPGSVISIWQTTGLNRCELYQQDWQPDRASKSASKSSSTTATPSAALSPVATEIVVTSASAPTSPMTTPTGAVRLSAVGWTEPVQIFPNLNTCPVRDRLWSDPQAQQIFWLWGEGTSSLGISTLEAKLAGGTESGQWSLPLLENFTFENPEKTGLAAAPNLIVLNELNAAFTEERLAVAGSADGEIWVTRSTEALTDFVYAPLPAWSDAVPITNPDQSAIDFSLVMDRAGQTHLIFTQSNNSSASDYSGSLGASMVYSNWNNTSTTIEANSAGLSNRSPALSNPVLLFPGSPNELMRQPELMIDEASQLLHLVWSGGDRSDILYSRVNLEKASVASEWFPPATLTSDGLAAWPQIGIDRTGQLYILYIIPLNEQRGIYLTKSEDRGQNWSEPVQVFDAATAGLQALDHLSMVIAPDGTIHAAWTETSPAGNGIPHAIYYMDSKDGGFSWSQPIVLTGSGNDWPKLIIAADQLHLLYAQMTSRGGQIWHRSIALNNTDKNWGPAIRVPGWDEVSLPYGIAATGALEEGSLYLVGVSPANGSISYSIWKDGNWGSFETYYPLNASSGGLGLQAAARPEGENLSVVWLTQPAQLYFTARRIETVKIPVLPTALPTLTPTIAPSPTPTAFVSTPTPDLNRVPPPNSSEQFPLVIGGILAALIILGFFTWNVISRQRK